MTVWELQDKIYTNAAGNIDSIEAEYWGTIDKNLEYAEEKRQLALDLVNLISTVEEQTKEKIRQAGTLEEAFVVDVRTFTEPPCPDNPMVVAADAVYHIPASVLDPKIKP